MNLSCNKPVTSGAGDTLTITCFTCGMPSSKEWAQKVRSRPTNPLKPYYPFLLHMHPPHGAALKDDGSTYICAFCHASLEAQWKNYERLPSDIPPINRKYNLHKFICAVCGVETYRKRVRTLPFQEFPFLANQRPAGSLTLGNNPLAVVCLDCSETLWAQSAEYDRWGLPIHKRRFNWLARPPPDPDSLEATVARLPSGETQLPRCPPTEPAVKPKEAPPGFEVTVKHKVKNSKSESSSSGGDTASTTRKNSLTSQTNPSIEASIVHPQPPVVTVAPLSTHTASPTSLKKDTLSVPPILTSSAYSKYDSLASCMQPTQMSHPLFHRTPIFPPGTYAAPFHWAGRDGSLGEHYAYPAMEALQSTTASPWAWLPPASAGLLPYQNYVPSTFASRGLHMNEPFYNLAPSYYPASPDSNVPAVATTTSTASHYVSPFSLPSFSRSASPPPPHAVVTSAKSSSSSSYKANPCSSQRNSVVGVDRETSSPVKRTFPEELKSFPTPSSSSQTSPVNKKANVKPIVKTTPETPVVRGLTSKKISVGVTAAVSKDINFKSSANPGGSASALPSHFKPKSNAIRNHINENFMIASQRRPSPDGTKTSGSTEVHRKLSEETVPKKWQWQSLHAKHRSKSMSESESMDCSASSQELGPMLSSSPPLSEGSRKNRESSSNLNSSDVIDLSLSSAQRSNSSLNSSRNNDSNTRSSKTFMIAYLCPSESSTTPPPPKDPHGKLSLPDPGVSEQVLLGVDSSNSQDSQQTGRKSVIFTAPKSDMNGHLSDDMEGRHALENASEEPSCVSNNGSDSDVAEVQHQAVSKSTEGDSGDDSEQQADKDDTQEFPALPDKEDAPAHGSTNNHSVCDKISQSELSSEERVCERNVQECVRKIITEHKMEEREAKNLKRKLEEDQEEFLQTLGLITPKKKADLELDILIKRSNLHTLPPLKLRPSTPPKVQLGEEFENQLLRIAFDDPSLKICDLNDDEVAFLAQLDLKPATKTEKNEREVQWRLVLTERMMREKRGLSLCGTKNLWTELASSKLLMPLESPNCENPDIFGSLSLTLPTFSTECSSQNEMTGSSDLLRIAENHSSCNATKSTTKNAEAITVSATCIMKPVISYPKYIPSYAAQVSVPSYVPSKPVTDNGSTSTDSSGIVSSRSASPDAHLKSSSVDPNSDQVPYACSETHARSSLTNGDSRILKVPVINISVPAADQPRNHVLEEPMNSKETMALGTSDACSASADDSDSHPTIESIIDADATNCEHFVSQINHLLNSTPTTSSTATRAEGRSSSSSSWADSVTEWRKLKKYLKTRQSQIKAVEDKLKKREKQILSQLRAFTNNTH